MEKFLTAKQLSEPLQVNLSTIYLWAQRNFMLSYKLGRSIRFLEKDVACWLAKHRRSAIHASEEAIVSLMTVAFSLFRRKISP